MKTKNIVYLYKSKEKYSLNYQMCWEYKTKYSYKFMVVKSLEI